MGSVRWWYEIAHTTRNGRIQSRLFSDIRHQRIVALVINIFLSMCMYLLDKIEELRGYVPSVAFSSNATGCTNNS